jgi:hypothetical protein
LLCYINDCKKSGVISPKKYELFLNNYREYNPTVGENECISREKIDTINDYFLKIDTSNENRLIKNIITEEKKIVSYIFEIDKKCKDGLIDYAEWKKEDKKSYDLLKKNKLQGLIDFISLKKYDYYSLTKIYYFFQHENNDFLKYNNDYDDLFNKLSYWLIREKSSKDGIQLEKKYDGLIPYCFYNGYDWIFSILVWAAKSIIRSNPNKMSLEETLSQFLDSEKSIDIDEIAKNYEWYNM